MNQAQRTFLINKIESSVKERVDVLNRSIPKEPSLSNYLFHAVMSGRFEIVSNEQIRKLILDKVLNSKEGEDWMSRSRGFLGSSTGISFEIKDLFIIPEDYLKLKEKHDSEKKKIQDEINNINITADSLITRIQLASDKTLQTMINEIDDMGNISLMDTKLKLLTQ